MGDVVAVLVVPASGDSAGLLKPGACGAMPPMVMPPDPEWERKELIPECGHWQSHPVLGWRAFEGCALPLWWDGALVPEGWDRARRRAGCWTTPAPTLEGVAGFAESLVRQGVASRVIRLTRDASGALVEVTP